MRSLLSWALSRPLQYVRTFFIMDHTINVKLTPLPICRHLDLTNCQWLKDAGVAHLRGLPHLAFLSMKACLGLKSIPEVISGLTCLQELDLSVCHKLCALPEGIGALSLLQRLKPGNCYQLRSLPEGVSGLVNLRTLDMAWCRNGLKNLPDGIGGLSMLQRWDMAVCSSLAELPSCISGLSSLEFLRLESEALDSLPETIGSLSALTEIRIMAVNLEALPESVGGLSALQILSLADCASTYQRAFVKSDNDPIHAYMVFALKQSCLDFLKHFCLILFVQFFLRPRWLFSTQFFPVVVLD